MENVAEKPILSPKGTFPAKVVKVIDAVEGGGAGRGGNFNV